MQGIHSKSPDGGMVATGFAELPQQIEQLRGSAINVLAASLCGDKLAAEYLLLQLVSRSVDKD